MELAIYQRVVQYNRPWSRGLEYHARELFCEMKVSWRPTVLWKRTSRDRRSLLQTASRMEVTKTWAAGLDVEVGYSPGSATPDAAGDCERYKFALLPGALPGSQCFRCSYCSTALRRASTSFREYEFSTPALVVEGGSD